MNIDMITTFPDDFVTLEEHRQFCSRLDLLSPRRATSTVSSLSFLSSSERAE